MAFEAPVKSNEAATAFGVSVWTLQRWCNSEGFFEEGEHYIRRSAHSNAPKLFDLSRCVDKLRRLGYRIPETTLARIADEA